jgi:two-component system sensor histidine kinase BaeS
MGFWPFRSLGARLGLAFVGVTLVAEGVFGLVTVLTEGTDLAQLASSQRAETAEAVVSALRNAYEANGGWQGADLKPAAALADSSGSSLLVSSAQGSTLLRAGPTESFSRGRPLLIERAVMVRGKVVATLRLTFSKGGLTSADRSLRSSLARSVALSAVLAAVGALGVALIAAQSLAKPIRRLADALRAVESGATGVRVQEPKGSTELAELERALNSMASSLERQEQLREAMVADLAHEFRTPLAILQAETEALVDGVSSVTPEALVSLHDESLRLGRMVEDFQSLASAQGAWFNLERSLVDLADVAADAAGSLESRFAMNGVALTRRLSPAVVNGDPRRLRQVVTNLLSNAAKFTPGGGKVDISVKKSADWARLEVSDSGPGIPDDEIQRIFDRFFRGRAGQASGGSGVGLAVVKDLVEAHGGEVHAESPASGGAVFVVRLPLALPPGKRGDVRSG